MLFIPIIRQIDRRSVTEKMLSFADLGGGGRRGGKGRSGDVDKRIGGCCCVADGERRLMAIQHKPE